jgi:hypothetical protein
MVFNVFICFIMFFDICLILFCKRAFAPLAQACSLCPIQNSKFRIQNSKFFSAKDNLSKNAAKVLIIFINTK